MTQLSAEIPTEKTW